MILVTGPMFSGKKDLVKKWFDWDEAEFAKKVCWDVEKLAAGGEELPALAQKLAQYQVVIASEIGGGIVPADPEQRRQRERAGRLACLLAEHARTVVRVCCGIPQVLKGELPPDKAS